MPQSNSSSGQSSVTQSLMSMHVLDLSVDLLVSHWMRHQSCAGFSPLELMVAKRWQPYTWVAYVWMSGQS